MRVKIISTVAYSGGAWLAGETVEVAGDVGRRLVAKGLAVEEPGLRQAVVEPRAEMAVGPGQRPAALGYGIAAVSGIGSKRQRQLQALGVRTVADLLGWEAEMLAAQLPGVGEATAAKWLETARLIGA